MTDLASEAAEEKASEEIATHSPQCTKMPCGHRFHENCLLQWLRSHNTCPVCRFAVEATETPRPTPLSTVLQNWHERMRAEQAAVAEGSAAAPPGGSAAAMAAAGAAMAAAGAAPVSQGGGGRAVPATTRSTRSAPAGAASSASVAHQSAAAAAAAAAAARPVGAGGGGRRPGLTEAQLQGLSVAELKRRLAELRVDFSQAVERDELVALLRRHARPAPQLHVQVHLEV